MQIAELNHRISVGRSRSIPAIGTQPAGRSTVRPSRFQPNCRMTQARIGHFGTPCVPSSESGSEASEDRTSWYVLCPLTKLGKTPARMGHFGTYCGPPREPGAGASEDRTPWYVLCPLTKLGKTTARIGHFGTSCVPSYEVGWKPVRIGHLGTSRVPSQDWISHQRG
jgi:hypothetical protein